MDRNRLEIEKRSVWSAFETKIGEKVSGEGRRQIEAIFGLTNEDTYAVDLRDYLQIFAQSIVVMNNFSSWDRYFSSRKQRVVSPNKKQYHRPFEKRLKLVNLVTDHLVTIFNMEHRSPDGFDHPLAFLNDRIPRIRWNEVCSQWNRDNPHDQKNLATLKVEYYRAIAEKDIQREFAKRINEKIQNEWYSRMMLILKETVQLNTRLVNVLLIIMHEKELIQKRIE